MARFKNGTPKSRQPRQITAQSNAATNSYGKKFMQYMKKQAALAGSGKTTGVGISRSGR